MGEIYQILPWGKKGWGGLVCVWHGEVQFRILAVCECIISCRQQQITEHMPSVHIQLLLVSAAHSWLFHIDAGSAHVPGGWQLSAPLISPPHPALLHLTSPFLSSFLSLPTVWLLLGAWLSRLAPFTETWRNVSMCVCSCDLSHLSYCKPLQRDPLLKKPTYAWQLPVKLPPRDRQQLFPK